MMSYTQQEAVAIYAGPGGLWETGDGESPTTGALLQPSDWNEVVYKVRLSSQHDSASPMRVCLHPPMSTDRLIDRNCGVTRSIPRFHVKRRVS